MLTSTVVRQLNVAPGVNILDLSQFNSVLVIIINLETNTLTGLWAPIDWVNYGANRATLKIVKTAEFDFSKINIINPQLAPKADQLTAGLPKADQLTNTSTNILISRPPLDLDEAINLIQTLNDKQTIFQRTLDNLEVVDRLAGNDIKGYNEVLIPLYGHLNAVTSTWLSRHKLITATKYDTDYILKEANNNILKRSQHEFNQLQHQISEPLPINREIASVILEMLSILNRGLAPKLIIDQFINNVLGSAELCGLLFVLNKFPDGLHVTDEAIIAGLNNLSHEETRVVLTTDAPITDDEIFIFEYDDLTKMNGMYSPADHISAINYYLGFPVNILDLSKSYLTGSILPATCCRVYEMRAMDSQNASSNSNEVVTEFDRVINTLYPRMYTIRDECESQYQNLDVSNHRRSLKMTVDINKQQVSCYLDSTHSLEYTLTLIPGADIDIAVDVKTEDEFDIQAQRHYQAIHNVYPLAKLERIVKPKGYTYKITNVPRIIEIYLSNRRHILTHHVPMTRGYITGNGDQMKTYLSASCVVSYITKRVNNYYYFAGKVSPMEILMKYEQRRFKIDIRRLTI